MPFVAWCPCCPLLFDVPPVICCLMSRLSSSPWHPDPEKPVLLNVLTVFCRLNVLNDFCCLMFLLSSAAWSPSCPLLLVVPPVLYCLMSCLSSATKCSACLLLLEVRLSLAAWCPVCPLLLDVLPVLCCLMSRLSPTSWCPACPLLLDVPPVLYCLMSRLCSTACPLPLDVPPVHCCLMSGLSSAAWCPVCPLLLDLPPDVLKILSLVLLNMLIILLVMRLCTIRFVLALLVPCTGVLYCVSNDIYSPIILNRYFALNIVMLALKFINVPVVTLTLFRWHWTLN